MSKRRARVLDPFAINRDGVDFEDYIYGDYDEEDGLFIDDDGGEVHFSPDEVEFVDEDELVDSKIEQAIDMILNEKKETAQGE